MRRVPSNEAWDDFKGWAGSWAAKPQRVRSAGPTASCAQPVQPRDCSEIGLDHCSQSEYSEERALNDETEVQVEILALSCPSAPIAKVR